MKFMHSWKIDNFYLFGIKVLIFLIPFLPLYVSSSMLYPHITGKSFAFRILIELAAVLWAGLIVLNREYRPRNSTILLSVLVFTFIVGLADLFGINPYNSFWSNYERMEGYITILHLTLYFMILKSILKTRKDWMIFFNLFVIVGLLVSLYALFQRFIILPCRTVLGHFPYFLKGNCPQQADNSGQKIHIQMLYSPQKRNVISML